MSKSLKNISMDAIAPSAIKGDEDADLIKLVQERLANDNGVRYTMEDIDKMFGFAEKDLEGWEEVKIE